MFSFWFCKNICNSLINRQKNDIKELIDYIIDDMDPYLDNQP